MAGIEKRQNRTTGPTWRVYWRQNGRRQHENFTTEHEADRFRELVQGSGNQWPHGWRKGYGFTGAAKTGAGLTFKDWAEQAVMQRTRANDRTKADYRRDLERHVYPHLGTLPVDGITDRDITAWLNTLEAVPLAQKTIANIHSLVSSIMVDGMHARPPVVDHNPFAAVLSARADVHVEEMVFLTAGEFDLIYRHIPSLYQPLTLMLWATGERFGEATAHQVRDLELTGRHTATVVRAWKRDPAGTYRLGEPKTPRSRRQLPLSPKLTQALRRQVAGKHPSDLVFPAPDGGQLHNSTYYAEAWAPAVRRAQACDEHYDEQHNWWRTDPDRLALQRATGRRLRFRVQPCGCDGTITKTPRIHDLRHSHASLLIAAGLPLPVISRRLGHTSIQITVDRYGHLLPELDDAVNAAVDSSLSWE